MAVTKDELLTKAMKLKPKDRALLAEEIWFSLDGSTKDKIHDAWASEVHKRLRALDRGEAELIPGDQAIREARKLVRKKRSV